jgi:phage gpG-like protein
MANQNKNNWAAIGQAIVQGAEEMAVEQAEILQGQVKSRIMTYPIYDTGRMYRSVYKKTSKGSDYEQEDELIMHEISEQPDDHTSYVAVGAVYGAIQNYGGHGIAGRPYWEPAILDAEKHLDDGLTKIANKVRKVSL